MTEGILTNRANRMLRIEPRYSTLLAILGAILAIRLVGLAVSNAELYFDEAQYWAWAQEPAFGYYTKPPLIAWLIAAGTAVCGDTPFCVRYPAPLVHFATALLVHAVALRLFDRRIAFWSSIVYVTMPGTSLSATLMSTDVPLLFFWTLGLLAIVRHVERPSLADGLLLGVAVGLGLNAKYAMIYLPLCFVLYAIAHREARRALLHPGTLLGLAVAVVLIAPNILWNAQHSFATFEHTRDNVSWGARFPNLLGVLEFVGTQAVILGPVAFAAYAFAVAAKAGGVDRRARALLVYHSLPVFLLIVVQAFVSRANGNWAATAFPAAAILGTAALFSLDWKRGLRATIDIAGVALVGVTFAGAMAGVVTWGPLGGELGKLRGWGDLAAKVAKVAEDQKVDTVVLTQRGLTASMIYELRDSGLSVKAWRPDSTHPRDHFELTRPWAADDPGPVLLVLVGDGPPPDEIVLRSVRVALVPTTVHVAKRNGWVMSVYRAE